MAHAAGRGGPKKRMLLARKGSRKHKAVNNGSNFAVLRKQADLGPVAVRRARWQRKRIMTEKLEVSKVNVMLLDHCLQNWHAIQWQQVHRKVSQLRQRIYRASVKGDLKKIRN